MPVYHTEAKGDKVLDENHVFRDFVNLFITILYLQDNLEF